MTSKQRLLAAIRSEPVDHVPLTWAFWGRPRHPRVTWQDERQRLQFYRERGWDAYISLWCGVRTGPQVRTEMFRERDATGPVLRQVWHTPAGTLTERLRLTDDWPEAQESTQAVGLLHDFRTSRYIEAPFKDEKDLATLPYLFPFDVAAETEWITNWVRDTRALADEFQVPIFVDSRPGLDWLLWLFPAAEAVLRTIDSPDMVKRLLAHIGEAYRRRVEIFLSLGIDGIIRSGWYESADLWSPALFRQLAVPALQRELRTAHAAGVPVVYLMDSGVVPLLPDLAKLEFDCLAGVDPATAGSTDLAMVRRGLPGKALWGGISGPLHLGCGTPAQVEDAVARAFAACGRTGFVLGPMVGLRYNWPWENFEACDRAWRRWRG